LVGNALYLQNTKLTDAPLHPDGYVARLVDLEGAFIQSLLGYFLLCLLDMSIVQVTDFEPGN